MYVKTAGKKLAMSYFGPTEGNMWDEFMRSALHPEITEKYEFFHTTDESCSSSYIATAPGLAITRNFDESPVAFTGAADAKEIVEWATKTAVPRLIEFSPEHADIIFKQKKIAVVLFSAESDTDYHKVHKQAADDMHGGDLLFVTSTGKSQVKFR